MEPWLIGMQLVLLGCFCSAVGLVLIKHSTNVEADKPMLTRKFWLAGFVFLVVNASIIDVFAFSLAPITLIAPFTGVTIVITSWLASTGLLYVKESLDMWDATSTAVTLVGVTITSIYGPHGDTTSDEHTLLRGFVQRDFLICFFVLVGAMALG